MGAVEWAEAEDIRWAVAAVSFVFSQFFLKYLTLDFSCQAATEVQSSILDHPIGA